MRVLHLTSVVGLVLAAGVAHARIVRDWTYDDLFKESDLIVIANVIETKVTPITDSLTENGLEQFGYPYEQLETVLRVRSVVKGKFDHPRLPLVHFRYAAKGLFTIDNGPMLFEFPKSDRWSRIGKRFEEAVHGPEYLLFLKARKDGKYAPVTGQVDPVRSVRALDELVPYIKGGQIRKD
jgi:hypothetical protein